MRGSHEEAAIDAIEATRAYVEDFLPEDEPLLNARRRGQEVGAMPIGPAGGAALRFIATLIGAPLSLTPTEFSLLAVLCENKGKVVSSEELFRRVWGEGYYTKDNNTITVHIRHLREKLGDSFERPKYIKTVWGVGYEMDA